MIAGPDFTDPAIVATRAITYNPDNMPTRIAYTKSGSTVTSDFTYDATSQRAMKATQGGSTTQYINANYEIKDGVITKYISAGNLKIAKIKGTLTSYFHKDHLGSSTVMTNDAGAKVEGTEYMPYGSTREQIGTTVTDYKYTGKELDKETGLYYYGARYYDPIIGRFITADPAMDAYVPMDEEQNLPAGGVFRTVNLNLYHYAANNPLIYTDPTGLFVWGAAIGFTVSTVSEVASHYQHSESGFTGTLGNISRAICATASDPQSRATIAVSTAIGALTSGASSLATNSAKQAGVMSARQVINDTAKKATIDGLFGGIGNVAQSRAEAAIKDKNITYADDIDNFAAGMTVSLGASFLGNSIRSSGRTKIFNFYGDMAVPPTAEYSAKSSGHAASLGSTTKNFVETIASIVVGLGNDSNKGGDDLPPLN